MSLPCTSHSARMIYPIFAGPTPSGVPVHTISHFSNVITLLTSFSCRAIRNSISSVLSDCFISPFVLAEHAHSDNPECAIQGRHSEQYCSWDSSRRRRCTSSSQRYREFCDTTGRHCGSVEVPDRVDIWMNSVQPSELRTTSQVASTPVFSPFFLGVRAGITYLRPYRQIHGLCS
jgi:hypothetical protein